VATGLVLLAGGARPAPAQQSPVGPPLTVAETESLVRRVAYEGLADADAQRIGPEGAARLVEMLADEDERPSHARILLALASWGGSGVLEAIDAWRDRLATEAAAADGELDRDAFRAWQALPFALGRLARRDPRAVDALAGRLEAEPPSFSFRQFSGARMQALERRAAVSALVESGEPAAARALDRAASRVGDPALIDHLRALRAEAAAGAGAETGAAADEGAEATR